MNILYIDHYAGTLDMGMEFRPYYFAREWKKMGHNVRIVGASFSHLRKYNPEITKDFEIQNIDGIEFQWIKTRTYDGNGAARAITMLEFCSKLWLKAKKIAKEFKPDVVIASSTYPLDTYPAQRIVKATKGKAILVHEVHDMWPITPIELYGMSKYHPFVVAMQVGENSFCKHSDLIASIPPCAEDYFKQHGLGDNKFVCIQNGIVQEDWQNPEALPEEHVSVIRKAKAEDRFVIGFFGSHTRSYCIDNLLRAASKIDQSKLFMMFVGNGDYKDELIKLAEKLELDKNAYAFLPPINKKAMPSLIGELDASYVGAVKNRMFRFGIGMNKLFDAMMGGKPVLYAVEAPNNYIEEYCCGISVEAEDIDELAKGIEELISLDEKTRAEMGKRGHEAVMESFTYSALAKDFIDTIEKKVDEKMIIRSV